MQRAIVALILIIMILGIYLFTQKPQTGITTNENAALNSETTKQSLSTSADATIDSQVVAAAKDHIQQLTKESNEEVIDITKADNFVTGEQLLQMPSMESETIKIEQIASSSAPAARTSIDKRNQDASMNTALAEIPNQESTAQATANPLAISDSVTVIVDAGTEENSQAVSAIAQAVQGIQTLTAPAQSQGQSFVVTQGSEPAISFERQVIKDSDLQVSAANTRSLRPGQQIRLQELLSDPDLAAGTVFYIHAVAPTDEQGLWGILQQGLIKTFAQGIELKQSGRVLTANIPVLADETLENRRSSFLGELLYQKVQDTYVYNYQQGMLGQDPNMVKPGQQLIIVSYTEDELISIFNHFTAAGI